MYSYIHISEMYINSHLWHKRKNCSLCSRHYEMHCEIYPSKKVGERIDATKKRQEENDYYIFFLFLQLESERKKTVTVTLEPEARNDELIRDISFYFSGSRRVRTYIIETMESLWASSLLQVSTSLQHPSCLDLKRKKKRKKKKKEKKKKEKKNRSISISISHFIEEGIIVNMSKYNVQDVDLETGKQVRLTGYSNAAFEDPLRSNNNDLDQMPEFENRLNNIRVCNQDDKTASNDGEFFPSLSLSFPLFLSLSLCCY